MVTFEEKDSIFTTLSSPENHKRMEIQLGVYCMCLKFDTERCIKKAIKCLVISVPERQTVHLMLNAKSFASVTFLEICLLRFKSLLSHFTATFKKIKSK